MSYHLLLPVHIIQAGDLSSGITSRGQIIQNQDNIGIQLDWTGDAVGTFGLQVSNSAFIDTNGNIIRPGKWVDLPLNPVIIAQGGDDSAYFELNQLSTIFLRILYASISGSGSVDAYLTGKGV